jgi:hypothetical protein
MAAHRLALLVGAGREHQIVAGMVIERSLKWPGILGPVG